MNMKKLKRIAAFLTLGIVLLMTACNDAPPVIKDASIIPIPMSLKQDTTCFVLPKSTTIGINDPQLRPAAEYLISVLKPATGYSFNINEGEGDIDLTVGEVSGVEDSYTLISNPEKVSITGNTYRGVVAGIQSLRQLFPAEIESDKKVNMSWGIPSVEIQDAPRFGWRGLMLDVSRHFYTKEEVKEFLDLMALYKFNKFHWHLTDDQGWRLEIKQYPLLTEKGAWRKFNNHDRDCIRYAAEQDNPDYEIPTDKIQVVEGDTLYGGFYTQDDVKEVIAYAQVRGIDIIPELDMPGHMLAAVSNYNGVSCFEETGWGSTFSSPVCPGKDSALEFCKNIYTELIELFPYEYVHIGGDEVEKTNWKKCPDCQARMKEHGLKTEEELQAWFIHEMEHFFNSKGKKMIGWDEIIEGGLSETATVMWWRSWEKPAPSKTINHGNNLIFSPNAPFYLDYAQDKKSVSNIYNYEPMKEVPDADKQHLVKGVQGNIWCEWIPTRERMHYMAAPRMLAIAELGWSANDRKDWNDFQVRMANQFGRLNVMDVQYRIPDLEGFMKSNVFIG
ncbi:MAG: beta-N-acetylhexosaminidase, partial [Bacteroides sp.]|nr:beta-N-acetylhexosaminidase [Bacteroides sp.]